MIRLNHTSELETVLKNTGRAVLLFTAPWCAQCKPLKRKIDHLPLIEVNADMFTELTTRYDVRGLPSVVVIERVPGLPDDIRTYSGQALKASVVKELFA